MSRITLTPEEKNDLLLEIDTHLKRTQSPSVKKLVALAKEILESKRKRLTALQWFALKQRIDYEKHKNEDRQQETLKVGYLRYADKNSEYSSEYIASLIHASGLKPAGQRPEEFSLYGKPEDLPENLKKYYISDSHQDWKNSLPKEDRENLVGKYYAKIFKITANHPEYEKICSYLEGEFSPIKTIEFSDPGKLVINNSFTIPILEDNKNPEYDEMNLYFSIKNHLKGKIGNSENSFSTENFLSPKQQNLYNKLKEYQRHQEIKNLRRLIFKHYKIDILEKTLYKDFMKSASITSSRLVGLLLSQNKQSQALLEASHNNANIIQISLLLLNEAKYKINFLEAIAKGASPHEEYKKLYAERKIDVPFSIAKRVPTRLLLSKKRNFPNSLQQLMNRTGTRYSIMKTLRFIKDPNHVPQNQKEWDAYEGTREFIERISFAYQNKEKESPLYFGEYISKTLTLKKAEALYQRLKKTDIPLLMDFLKNYEEKNELGHVGSLNQELLSLSLKTLVECEKRYHQSLGRLQDIESSIGGSHDKREMGTKYFPNLSMGNGYVLEFAKTEQDLKDLGNDQKNCIGGAVYRHINGYSMIGKVTKDGKTILSVDIKPVLKDPKKEISLENIQNFVVSEMRSYRNDAYEKNEHSQRKENYSKEDLEKIDFAKKFGQESKDVLKNFVETLSPKLFDWTDFSEKVKTLSKQNTGTSYYQKFFRNYHISFLQREVWKDILRKDVPPLPESTLFNFKFNSDKTLHITPKSEDYFKTYQEKQGEDILRYILQHNINAKQIYLGKDTLETVHPNLDLYLRTQKICFSENQNTSNRREEIEQSDAIPGRKRNTPREH